MAARDGVAYCRCCCRCRLLPGDQGHTRVSDGHDGISQAKPNVPPEARPSSSGIDWVQAFLSKLDAPALRAVKQALERSAGFTTAYSGAGFFESMISQLCAAFEITAPPCLHACDVSPLCQRALTRYNSCSPTSPQCVFGDLRHRVRRSAYLKMRRIQ